MSVIVIPCWNRPAHLAATLTCLANARGADAYTYLFAIDRGAPPEIGDVINAFPMAFRRRIIVQGEHPHAGPALNLMGALQLALYDLGPDDHALLVEEDVLLATDALEVVRDGFALDPIVVGVGLLPQYEISIEIAANAIELHPGEYPDTAGQMFRSVTYTGRAVALRAPFVERITQHATTRYYADPSVYCGRELPDAGLETWEADVAGLVTRMMRRDHEWLLYPVEPRAAHVGWYGYRRPSAELTPEPTLWRELAPWILNATGDQLNALADPRFRDLVRPPLIRSHVPLRLV